MLPARTHQIFVPYLALALIFSFSCSNDTTIRGVIGLPLENDLLNSTISFSGSAIADNTFQVEVTVLLKNSNGSSIVGSHLNLEIESGDGVTVLGAVLRFRHQWKVFMRYHYLCTRYKDHTSIRY